MSMVPVGLTAQYISLIKIQNIKAGFWNITSNDDSQTTLFRLQRRKWETFADRPAKTLTLTCLNELTL